MPTQSDSSIKCNDNGQRKLSKLNVCIAQCMYDVRMIVCALFCFCLCIDIMIALYAACRIEYGIQTTEYICN